MLGSIIEPLRLERLITFELKSDQKNNRKVVEGFKEEDDDDKIKVKEDNCAILLKEYEFNEEGIRLSRDLSKIERN